MGVISGKVTRSNGQPQVGVEVSAKVPGLTGGMTRTVRTDNAGNFLVEWSSNSSSIEIFFVRGRALAHNVQSGRNNLHLILD
jgi:hypothetical protein